MPDNLDKNILSTVCYYDALDYPLTAFEIWKYLVEIKDENKSVNEKEIKLKDVLAKLESDALRRFIEKKRGMYFLKGKKELVKQRIKRDKLSVLKIKRLGRTVWFLRLVPFVRAIFITGRLAMKNAKFGSDWDVLVVLKGKRIWTGRTLITLFSHILGKRRHHNKTKDRVCLNYFITTNSLEIRNKDLFSANEYSFCIPIFDSNKYFEKFQIKNSWIKKYKPNYCLTEVSHLKKVEETAFSKSMRNILEKIFDWDFLEKFLRKIETKKIENNPNTKKEDSLIVADDKALIFLPEPQGPKIFEEFKDKVNNLSV